MKLTPYQRVVLEKMSSGAALWRAFQSHACWLETPDGRERIPFHTVGLLIGHGLIEEQAGEFRTSYVLTDAGRASGEA